jgi:hypothetical protein
MPKQRIKSSRAVGEKPLTAEELKFCQNYCLTGNQSESVRMTWPDVTDVNGVGYRLMRRTEIKEQIKAILAKMREQAADASARAMMLTLSQADLRLAELLTQRRRTRGEMLTRDTKELHVPGVSVELVSGSRGGKPLPVQRTSEEFDATLNECAPIEDTDLIKAIDLTYERLGGYPDKKAEQPTQTNVYLYKPQWLMKQQSQEAPQLEAEVE